LIKSTCTDDEWNSFEGCYIEIQEDEVVIPTEVTIMTDQERYNLIYNESKETFDSFKQKFISVVVTLSTDGIALPEPLTFRALSDLLDSVEDPKYVKIANSLTLKWLDVVYACDSDMRLAHSLLPYILGN
jgi:hypothetical protein